MPIYLPAPAHRNGGPDGQGWNRIALGSLASDECALRPRTPAALMESWNTFRARYGGFGPCMQSGRCDSCLFMAALSTPTHLESLDDRVLFRVHPQLGPMAMNRPEDGWASLGMRWSWDDLARLSGWEFDGFHRDDDSDGFWLRRATA